MSFFKGKVQGKKDEKVAPKVVFANNNGKVNEVVKGWDGLTVAELDGKVNLTFVDIGIGENKTTGDLIRNLVIGVGGTIGNSSVLYSIPLSRSIADAELTPDDVIDLTIYLGTKADKETPYISAGRTGRYQFAEYEGIFSTEKKDSVPA